MQEGIQLQILIPTYNRGKDLAKNLRQIAKQIMAGGFEEKVGILISDNCSPDNTQELVDKLTELQANSQRKILLVGVTFALLDLAEA